MKKWMITTVAIGLIFALSACGTKEQPQASQPAANGSTAAQPTAGGAAGSSASSQQINLIATNYAFDQKEYKVKKGQEVTFTLENQQGLHGIAINGLNVNLDNKNKTATVIVDKEGSYDIICSIPCGSGHMSMRAKLIVEA